MRGRWLVKGAAFLVLAAAALAAFSYVAMSLWNWLIPPLFHGPTLQFWQALGLLVLSRILFGGLRGRGHWHGHWRGRQWRERWASMTEEERERLRERYMSRCGHHRGAAPNTGATEA